MSSIETHHVSNGTTIVVPINFKIMQLLPPVKTSANDWPSCRVVVQDFTPFDNRVVKLNFRIVDEGELSEGYGYVGTVVHQNPRYIAHFAYKIIQES